MYQGNMYKGSHRVLINIYISTQLHVGSKNNNINYNIFVRILYIII